MLSFLNRWLSRCLADLAEFLRLRPTTSSRTIASRWKSNTSVLCSSGRFVSSFMKYKYCYDVIFIKAYSYSRRYSDFLPRGQFHIGRTEASGKLLRSNIFKHIWSFSKRLMRIFKSPVKTKMPGGMTSSNWHKIYELQHISHYHKLIPSVSSG